MTKGLVRSLTRGNPLEQKIMKQSFNFAAVAMVVDGASGVGFGTLVVSGLPVGNVVLLAAVASLQFAGSGSDGDLSDTWAGDYGVGTTPASDGTITGQDVDIIASTALAAATAEVSPVTKASNVTPALLDNTGGALEINLNVLIDDADISANGVAIAVTGSLDLSFVMLGTA